MLANSNPVAKAGPNGLSTKANLDLLARGTFQPLQAINLTFCTSVHPDAPKPPKLINGYR